MKGKLTDDNSGISFDDGSFSVLLMNSLIPKNKRHNSQLVLNTAKIKLIELQLMLTPTGYLKSCTQDTKAEVATSTVNRLFYTAMCSQHHHVAKFFHYFSILFFYLNTERLEGNVKQLRVILFMSPPNVQIS